MDIPFHPKLVHYPIAFLLGAVILHAVQLWRPYWICRIIGMWLLGLASIFSIFSALSGIQEATRAEKVGYPSEVLEIMSRHETMGNLVTWGSIFVLIAWIFLFFKNMEDRRIDTLVMAFLILLMAMALITANLGGELVWNHGVGLR